MALEDKFTSTIDDRVPSFGIEKGMTVVDYGCGPGRYTKRYAKLVGKEGKVYAVDIHDLAIKTVQKIKTKYQFQQVETIHVTGYDTGLPDHSINVVTTIDMIHGVPDPIALLKECHRITKQDGHLIIDDNHRPREQTRKVIEKTGCWAIVEDTPDHLKCTPK